MHCKLTDTDSINREDACQGINYEYIEHLKIHITEYYLNSIKLHWHRSAYAKFRCSVAPICLETGRYERLSKEQRTCFHRPNSNENEKFILIHCPKHRYLTLKVQITTIVVCFVICLCDFKSHFCKQCGPRSECSSRIACMQK